MGQFQAPNSRRRVHLLFVRFWLALRSVTGGKKVVVVSDCRIVDSRRGFVVAGGIVVVGKLAVGSRTGLFVVLGLRTRNGMLIGLVTGVRRCCRVRPL